VKFSTDQLHNFERQIYCSFGIEEVLIGTTLAEVLGGGIGGGLAAGALEGAAGGAALSGLTGGDPLTGALTGGLSGGVVGGIGGAGFGTGAQVAGGAAAGAAGSALTGGNPLFGALGGGATGLISGGFGGGSGGASTGGEAAAAGAFGGSANVSPMPASGGGTSAVSSTTGIAPSGGAPVDLTSGLGGGGIGGGTDAVTSMFGGTSNAAGGEAGATGDFSPRSDASGNWASKIMGLVEKNPGVLLGGAVLGAEALMGNQPLPAERKLTQAASEAAGTGKTLSSYIFSGTLPAGAREAVDAATNAAKARVKSSYGQMGLAGSTMEAQAMQQIDQAAAAQSFQMADQLLREGADFTKLSDTLLSELLKTQQANEGDFTRSLGMFAAGLAGAKLNTSST
jgi:hypothetical protein